jgi:glycerate 2-kinase
VKIVVATDSFKGSLPASEVVEAIRQGLLQAAPSAEIVTVPIADGGEGTVQALVEATGGRYVTERVQGPLGNPVRATFGVLGDAETAVIEMAAASGLPLVPEAKRNPLLTSTFGTGQLIKSALDLRCTTLVIGIGGSATNDGGAGMAQALGVKMVAVDGTAVRRATGGHLKDIVRINMSQIDRRLELCKIRVACDVDNPLYGPTGAAYVFGPQKGATPEQIEELDQGLRHFATLIERDLGMKVADVPGAGAAGGLGAGLIAFCGAALERGAKIVSDTVGLREKIEGADLVITGEGKLDMQTAFGKAPSAPIGMARELGIPVIAICGMVAEETLGPDRLGLDAVFSLVGAGIDTEEAMRPERARELLALRAQEAYAWAAQSGALKAAPG